MSIYSTTLITTDSDMNHGSYLGYNYFFINCTDNITISLPTVANCYNGLAYKFIHIGLQSASVVLASEISNTTINAGETVEIVYNDGSWFIPIITYG